MGSGCKHFQARLSVPAERAACAINETVGLSCCGLAGSPIRTMRPFILTLCICARGTWNVIQWCPANDHQPKLAQNHLPLEWTRARP